MAQQIQIRNGISTAWTSANPILAVGELAIESDTKKFKIGDGLTLWASLPYSTQGETGLTGLTGKGLQYAWNGTQLGVRVEGDVSYTYVNLIGATGNQGVQGVTGGTGLTGNTGATGNGLEFNWSGTQLGVRVAGSPTYTYVNLVGPQGIQGVPGTNGTNGTNGLPGADGAAPTTTNIGTLINGATAKTTPVDADMVGLMDSAASNLLKKLSWLNIKATLKTYFDTLYNLYSHPTGDGNLHVPATGTTNNAKVLTAGATAGSLSWATPPAGVTVENSLTSDSTVNAVSVHQVHLVNDLVSTNTADILLRAKTIDYTATITTTWTGTVAPYTQAVTVTGILSTDKPLFDIVPSGTYATDIQMETDWSNVYRMVTSTNTVTFYAHAKSIASIPVQIKVVR